MRLGPGGPYFQPGGLSVWPRLKRSSIAPEIESLHEGLEWESDFWAALTGTEDMKEGATAFIEKRSRLTGAVRIGIKLGATPEGVAPMLLK